MNSPWSAAREERAKNMMLGGAGTMVAALVAGAAMLIRPGILPRRRFVSRWRTRDSLPGSRAACGSSAWRRIVPTTSHGAHRVAQVAG